MNANKHLCLLALFFGLTLLSRWCQADMVLVKEGRPAAQIVLNDDASNAERVAVSELQRIVHRMSGCRLPIVSSPGDGANVLVGAAGREALGEGLFEGLAFGAYRIAAIRNVLVIAGRTDVGTSHGVYGFLQDHLGVRWFMPSEAFEVVRKRRTISIGNLDETSTPAFACRLFSGMDGKNQDMWRRHLRLSPHDWRVPYQAGFTHWLYRIYPGSKYAKSDPDIYPLLGGKRAEPPGDAQPHWQPCTSNPRTIEIAVKTIRAYFDQHPDSHCYSLSINDNSNWCQCDRCKALDIDRAFRGRKVFSDRYYEYVNAVARGLRQTHPDKFVGCFAYASVEPPPDKIARLEPNVFINITQDTSQYYDEEYKEQDYDFFEKWQAKCDHTGKYDYHGLGALAPRYYPHLIAADLRHSKEIRLEALHTEAYPYWPNFGPQIYLCARMMWDASLNEDELLRDMFDTLFGPASEEMAAFYDTLERAWMTPREGRWFQGIGSAREQLEIFTSDIFSKLGKHIAAAQKLAPDGPIRERVAYIEKGFRYPGLLIRSWLLANEIEAADDAEEIIEKTIVLARLLEEAPKRWQESVMDDPNMTSWYKRGARARVKSQWRARCCQTIHAGLSRLETTKGKSALDAALSKLMAAAPESSLALTLRAYRGDFDELPNLVKNSGFEETKGNAGPDGPEWVAEGAPPHWSTWKEIPHKGRIWRDAKTVHSGKLSAALTGGKCLCYITTIPAEPGEQYVGWAYARAENVSATRRTTFEVRWRDKKGAWYSGGDNLMVELPKSGTWQRLVTGFTPPDGAAEVVLLLVAYDLPEGESVWFDDVFVARVK